MITIPKSITICGLKFKIRRDTDGSGWFSIDEQEIRIPSSKNNTKENIERVFIHEVVEVILACMDYRYQKYYATGNEQFLYCMNHHDFCLFINELHTVLRQIKWEGR